MVYFTLFISFVLLILAISLQRRWYKKDPQQFTYSILIACRNEVRNLPHLFSALDKLDYPHAKYEVIIVDDASSDGSGELLRNYAETSSQVKIFFLNTKSELYKGKKAALKKAAETAQYDILLFTDADCLPDKNWLLSYNHFFDDKTGMVVGYSPEHSANGFVQFTQIFNAGLYAATIGLGSPFSCSGRNFAIKKSLFQQIGGYDSFRDNLAGDDKQLLNLVVKNKFTVAYNNLAPVYTASTDKLLDQQKRRYSKFAQHRPIFKLTAVLIFLFYVNLPWFIFTQPVYLSYYFLALILFWLSNIHLHREKFHFRDLLYCLILPYYMIFYSIWGMFSQWHWKGNK